MKPVYMERHDPSANLHRFYQVMIASGVFNDWSVVREWGRCGSPGTLKFDWYESYDEAIKAAQSVVAQKTKKGYHKK